MSPDSEMRNGARSKRSWGMVMVPFPQQLTTTAVPTLAASLDFNAQATAHAIPFYWSCLYLFSTVQYSFIITSQKILYKNCFIKKVVLTDNYKRWTQVAWLLIKSMLCFISKTMICLVKCALFYKALKITTIICLFSTTLGIISV